MSGAPEEQRRRFTDPVWLRGRALIEVDRMMPTGWVRQAARTSGMRYVNLQRPGEQVRAMAGNPRDPEPVKRGPYARVSRDGTVSPPIPLAGNPLLRDD